MLKRTELNEANGRAPNGLVEHGWFGFDEPCFGSFLRNSDGSQGLQKPQSVETCGLQATLHPHRLTY